LHYPFNERITQFVVTGHSVPGPGIPGGRIALLAENPTQHVYAHRATAVLNVADGEITPQMGDDIEDHGRLGPFPDWINPARFSNS
jgi:hypothetical protein